ncbi:MAG: DUF1294 domain-containing protein [Sphingobium sp.]|nr:DUF1294 domain-containing protein [Sphingobium sp.]
MQPEVGAYLLLANLCALIAFGYDKARARAGKRRVRERDLLLFALLGGSAGAIAGRWLFRHKTRKLGFSVALLIVAATQAVLLTIFVARS